MAARSPLYQLIGLFVIAMNGCSLNDTQCANKVLQTVQSPSGEVSAVVFVRACGATTGDSLQISVMNSGSEPKDKGNVLILDSVPISGTGAAVFWRDEETLAVNIPKEARIFLMADSVGDVHVEFRRLEGK